MRFESLEKQHKFVLACAAEVLKGGVHPAVIVLAAEDDLPTDDKGVPQLIAKTFDTLATFEAQAESHGDETVLAAVKENVGQHPSQIAVLLLYGDYIGGYRFSVSMLNRLAAEETIEGELLQ